MPGAGLPPLRRSDGRVGLRSRSIAGRSTSDTSTGPRSDRATATTHPLQRATGAPEPVGQRERALARAPRQEQRDGRVLPHLHIRRQGSDRGVIVSGRSLSAVGRQFSMDRDALRRHRDRHMSMALTALRAEQGTAVQIETTDATAWKASCPSWRRWSTEHTTRSASRCCWAPRVNCAPRSSCWHA